MKDWKYGSQLFNDSFKNGIFGMLLATNIHLKNSCVLFLLRDVGPHFPVNSARLSGHIVMKIFTHTLFFSLFFSFPYFSVEIIWMTAIRPCGWNWYWRICGLPIVPNSS